MSPKAAPSAPGSTAGALDALSQASRSSSEHFYDALEEVPKGVRAAVQIFEVRLGTRCGALEPDLWHLGHSAACTAGCLAHPGAAMLLILKPRGRLPVHHPLCTPERISPHRRLHLPTGRTPVRSVEPRGKRLAPQRVP